MGGGYPNLRATSASGERPATFFRGGQRAEDEERRGEARRGEAVPIFVDAGGWGVARKVFGDTKLEALLHAFNEAIAA